MTDEQIDRMIAAREKLTNVRDEQVDWDTVDAIDAMLRDVPAGRRNDVDLLIGRRCAVLPDRADYKSLTPKWYASRPQRCGTKNQSSISHAPKYAHL